ncbi:hypothetical protein C2857_004967 [Epichloe festucae Fl1]|uniref:Amine oxidase domain-containing protein n=1 Tax=Epichloe festucae (strain Fl1) TaxID=877507 RepID=A0A7S9KKR9_EPIFF|nr:hypothetical protein C2857_004967 [Epichloe festucae Fl1]
MDEQKHEKAHKRDHRPTECGRETRVAIIGTGLAGLTTAYLLGHDKQNRFAVTLFEQAKTLSLDAASLTMVHENTGIRERVDIPPRSFCRGYYANLCRMYDYLGIQFQQISLIWIFATASTTAASETPSPKGAEMMSGSYFIYGKGWDGLTLLWRHSWCKGTRQILETFYLVFCHVWFYACCLLVKPRAVRRKAKVVSDSSFKDPSVCEESLGDYLQRIRLSQWYMRKYLLPVVSAICSCPHTEALDFPASDITGFVKGSFRQKFFVNKDGINRVQSRLSEGIKDVRLQARVLKVHPVDGKVLVRWQWTEDGSDQILEELFDRAVLAMAPNIAASIFDQSKPMLSQIPTASIMNSLLALPSESISVVQEREHIPAGQCTYRGGDIQTMIFRTNFSANIVESEALHYLPSGVIIKTSSLAGDAESRAVLYAVEFPRTLRTVESRSITGMITGESNRQCDESSEAWYSGRDNVWVAGSWCWDGLVLLEGCVVSAMRVAKDFDVEIPW